MYNIIDFKPNNHLEVEMIKKLMAVLIASAMLAALSSCVGSDIKLKSDDASKETSVNNEENNASENDDYSFGDASGDAGYGDASGNAGYGDASGNAGW